MTGCLSEEIVGKSVDLLMPRRSGHCHQSFIEQFVDTGESTVVNAGLKERHFYVKMVKYRM
ncbi:hypothetical protein HUE57_13565 [Candidatus Reidiella endopervernicosa]|uniref:PAS domain-containing protein n=1 Tax=Candidatus Reidiella endopervernicosa TaxID=2738883 RepID=A0A6N0I0Z5_9GAMM|nr:hypothetical protein HUE57_13565 [Candidatus Reidiella endopervernicosa]